jgi:hypothetical protein
MTIRQNKISHKKQGGKITEKTTGKEGWTHGAGGKGMRY